MEYDEPLGENISPSPDNNPSGNAVLLNSAQANQLNEQLSSLDLTLAGAVEKLGILHEPLKPHGDADLYKQPESNLLAYVRQLTAAATANVLDILESLPEIMNEARARNIELLETLDKQQSATGKLEGTMAEISDHLTQQNEMMRSVALAHGDILSLHSFQDLASQAVIRAEGFAGEIKEELEDAHRNLLAIRGLEKIPNAVIQSSKEESPGDSSQLDQSDVDSLFNSVSN